MRRTCIIVTLLTAWSYVAVAQEPSTDQANPEVTLSRELELERDLALAKIEAMRLSHQLRAVEAQLDGAIRALTALLQRQTAESDVALTAELKPLEERLVRAYGGDPEKGDRYSWQTKAVVKGK